MDETLPRFPIHERELVEIDGDWSLLPSDRFSERIKDVSFNAAAQAQYCNLLDMSFDLPAHRVRIRGNLEWFRSQDKHVASQLELLENKK